MSDLFRKFAEHTANYNLEVQCAMDGDHAAEIAIIGEYPGETEVAFNKPFTGGSGKHLWNALRAVKILRNQCYSTNLVKRRVTPRTTVQRVEFELWKEALQFELAQLSNLKAILLLGNSACSAILNMEGITQLRGSVYEYNGTPVIVANNPAMILRDPSLELVFLMDMQKLKDVLTGDYKPHRVVKHINPTFDEAMDYMERCRKHGAFAMDIEVIGMETACIGLAPDAHEAMCIPFRGQRDHYFTVEEEYRILRKFAEITDDVTTLVIGQNANFDSYFMGFKDNCRFRVGFDTLLAHHTLYPRLPHNLGFLTAQYTYHPYYKDEKTLFKESGDINDFWRYNCTDAAITYAIAMKQQEELKDQGLLDFFTSHVMRLHPHLAQATVDGVKVDMVKKEQLRLELAVELTEHYRKFQHAVTLATGDSELVVNPDSPKQMADLFFDRLHCTATTRSTAAPIRENWLKDPRTSESTREVIIAVNNYAEQHKFFSTYVSTQIDDDNRFRSEWKQYGTTKAPGRLSSGQTLWGSGGNSQNQPRRAYEMYLADDNCIFIYFDLAQAEARYVGWDANIEQWITDFEKARLDGEFDAHRSLAATMFNIPYDEVPKKDELDGMGRSRSNALFDQTTAQFTTRYIAKRCRHGLNYRMHIGRLAQTTGLSLGSAAKNYYAYHRTNPELRIWWDALERETKRKKMLFNSLGRRLFFTERLDNDEALESIVAFRPQSTIGDKVSQVWYQSHEDSRWDIRRARVCVNAHDALWAIATPGFAETALSIMKAYAETPIFVTSTVTGKTSPMILPADLKISDPEQPMKSMANMKAIKLEAARL